MTSAPFEPLRGTVPRNTSSLALAARDPGETMPAAQQMTFRCRTAWVDLALDGDVLYGRPRSAVGYATRLDGPALAAWAEVNVPRWQHLDAAGWAETAQRLTEWVRERDAATAAAVPADVRRAAELAAERVRDARRVELERQAAEAQVALAEFAAAPTEVEPARRAGWMRRPPAP